MILFSSWILNLMLFCTSFAILLYMYFTRNFDYWKKRGVYYPSPIPFFGNFYEVGIFKTTIYELLKKLYDDVDNPYFGIFVFDEPVLIVKSPEMIKNILIKDFSNFCDRSVAKAEHNKVIANFIFIQRNPRWKQTRSKLTPLFSSVMTKRFFINIKETSELLTDYLEQHPVINAKEVAGHFSTEVIARCFYGVNPRCFEEEISVFRQYVDKICNFRWRNAIIQTLYLMKPSWVDFFKLDFIENDIIEYFHSVFMKAMAARAGNKTGVKNLVDLMNDAQQGGESSDYNISDLDAIQSNALLFMIAGQETTSSMVSYTLYELALNQDIQEKLREEIQANVCKFGDITFEGLQEMKYLEMCINETMRKYTALPLLDRVARSDYRVEGTDFIIEKGTKIFIPFFAIQRDEKYFNNPDEYNPDRFLENNYNSNGLRFMPFGEGPRSCIGKRLAMVGMSVAVASILLKYKLEKCENTPDPVEFEPKSFTLQSKIGLPIRLKRF